MNPPADSYGPGVSEILIAKALYPYPAGNPGHALIQIRSRP
jgi:aryl-alcohol dehydrogenase-like predicted oxidoreductase